jgi:hypothetical protein
MCRSLEFRAKSKVLPTKPEIKCLVLEFETGGMRQNEFCRNRGSPGFSESLLAKTSLSRAVQLDWRSEFNVEDRVRHCDGLFGKARPLCFRVPVRSKPQSGEGGLGQVG